MFMKLKELNDACKDDVSYELGYCKGSYYIAKYIYVCDDYYMLLDLWEANTAEEAIDAVAN